MNSTCRQLVIGVFVTVVTVVTGILGCGRSGLPAGGTGDAAIGGAGGKAPGSGHLDALGAGGRVSGGDSGAANGGTGGGGLSGRGGGAGTGGTTAGNAGGVNAGSPGGSTSIGGGRSGGSGGSTAVGGGGVGGGSSGGSASTSGGRGGGAGGSMDGGAGNSSAGDGGILASGYCTGTRPKVTYKGQEVTPSVTNYRSGLVMDCCSAVGVNLRTQTLGFDLQVEVIMSGTPAPGEHNVDASSFNLRAAMHTAPEPLEPSRLANGSIRITGDTSGKQAWELALCLQMDDAASPLVGTRIYVPSVAMCSVSGQQRLQFYLLQDPSLSPDDVASLSLDSLTLAGTPLVDLGSIAYVEQATGRVGLNPGQQIGTSLRSKISPLKVYGLPFVVVADSVRIYVGSFTSPVSSIRSPGPYVYMDSAGASRDGISADGFVIQPPAVGFDPRNDRRILQVLTETGKLVP